MKRDEFTLPLGLADELIIDNFAGGGGTSEGLEQAFGRPVDIAINHDPEALAMHAANHPHTKHLCESVWDVDPIKVTGNQPVGLVWLSPDCKHFSKAKGGKPVEKKIRGLAWVTLRWAAKCKPRVIMLENVEEFKTWGPLLVKVVDGQETWMPDPAKKGKTFESFVRQLKGHGYDVDWRELRACDHDTPTIRKRFFMVARRDGIPIQWPEPTHGAPDSLGVKAGKLQPYRTAAECIDWSLPCPSIFDRKKPLAEATLRRIAKGIMRYVVNSPSPFIVNTANSKTTGRGPNVWGSDEPVRTIMSSNGFSVVEPTIVPVILGQGGPAYSGKPVSANQPLGTLPTENHRAVMTAVLTGVGGRAGQSRPRGVDEPTATATSKYDTAVVAATMVQTGYGERDGQAPRALDIEKPLGTVVGSGKAAVVSALLVDAAHADVSPSGVKRWGQGHKDIETPFGTVAGTGNQALVSAFLAKHYTGVVGSDLEDPIGTVTSSDHHSLVTAHIQRDMGQSVGHGADDPLGTVTAGGGGKSRLVASHLVKLRGTSNAAAADEPLSTVSAGGLHHAEVRAFLLKYYGTDQDPRLEEPLHTVTTKDRYGLVTIAGQDYQIVDIGLRMLAPPELFRAQGFNADYIIDSVPDWEKLFVDGEQVEDIHSIPWRPLTKSAQVRMCGNSVCPPMARALIQANFAHERQIVRAA
jgi:DNA (cytosine-5)-methyltransferase 1